MSIFVVLIVLALIGLLTWALVTFVPQVGAFRTLIIAAAVILSVLWLLHVMGLDTLTFPRVR